MERLILAGDVGGTKVALALLSRAEGRLRIEREERFRTAGADSLETIVARFLGDAPPAVAAAGFGVAGPVRDGVARPTNIPWVVDARRLAERLGLGRVGLVNDLVAMGLGISALPPEGFAVLNVGNPDATGNGALIAAGTGLGQAILIDDDRDGREGWRPVPSEGGHAGFAPQSSLEEELLAWLRDRFSGPPSHGHVSVERVLSGPGLHNIYLFLRDSGRGEEFDWIAARMQAEDPPRVISELAMAGESPLCELALETFVGVYAAQAANLALTALATGGVYLGGGIAPAILPALQRSVFLRAFLAKGRVRDLLDGVPVKVVLDSKAPLYGAAVCAEKVS